MNIEPDYNINNKNEYIMFYIICFVMLLIGPFRNIPKCPMINLKQLSNLNITKNNTTNTIDASKKTHYDY